MFVDPTRKKSKVILKCHAKPGEFHIHEELSQEMLELAVIRWLCVLRIFSHRSQETNLQSIEFVLSSWPHKISFPSSFIESRLCRCLNYYRYRADNKEFVETFLDQFDENKVALFREVILQFRSSEPADAEVDLNLTSDNEEDNETEQTIHQVTTNLLS